MFMGLRLPTRTRRQSTSWRLAANPHVANVWEANGPDLGRDGGTLIVSKGRLHR